MGAMRCMRHAGLPLDLHPPAVRGRCCFGPVFSAFPAISILRLCRHTPL